MGTHLVNLNKDFIGFSKMCQRRLQVVANPKMVWGREVSGQGS